MRVLSLFDGMACAMLAMQEADIPVSRYVAYEIEKYAIQTSTHNFPMIEHKGDVFTADFTEYEGFDFLMGGSPCTYWSIAQKNNRETEASGMGWELFSQYVRALKEVKPKYFIYENNKSMSKAIRESISSAFGFEPVLINSALVSAQNRQRLYWCGIRQPDGTYKKADIPQPEDRGILLKDILESGGDLTSNDKSYVLTASYNGAVAWNTIERSQRNMVAEPVRIPEYGNEDKSRPLGASYKNKGSGEGSLVSEAFPDNPNKQKFDYVAEPIRVGALPRPNGELSTSQAFRIYSTEGKSININAGGGGAGGKTGLYAEPVNVTPDGKSQTIKATYNFTSIPNICCYSSTYGSTGIATPTDEAPSEQFTGTGKDRDAMKRVYEVKNGQITIKGKQYPIKLADGFYIIRKLTVRECMRLQTVPEWYEFPVSNSQAYKMLGNGWTVSVIAHLLTYTMKGNE
ncbi:MAG: DNA cytosine methyltransferase [Oscillospiraceae bacterium]|nr:DNA cytosine methyltransferase [Oscillospiraceae bacterium]